MLSLATRKRLHDIGWTEIHQSQIRKANRCGEQLRLSLSNTRGVDGATSLLGTVFHEAIARPEDLMKHGMTSAFWRGIMTDVRDKWKRDYELHGKLMQEKDYDWLVDQLHTGDKMGMRAHYLATMVLSELTMYGWNVTHSELHLEWVDVGEEGEEGYGQYPIVWDGTLDMKLHHPKPFVAIADVKTTGLWGPIVKRRGEAGRAVKAQKWSGMNIAHHRQLRHYDWLHYKITGERADVYGLIHPANLIPYKVGPKKGQIRAPSVSLGPVLRHGQLDQYEEDLKRQMSIWSLPWGLGRDYPEIYGKSECPQCRYFKHCVGSKATGIIAPRELADQYIWEQT